MVVTFRMLQNMLIQHPGNYGESVPEEDIGQGYYLSG